MTQTATAQARPAEVRRRRRRRVLVRAAIQIAFMAGAAVFLVDKLGSLGAVAGALKRVSWHWMLMAVAAQALAMLALALAQHLLLVAAGGRSRVPRMTAITLGSNAVARSLPAGIVFAEGYAFTQFRRMGADAAAATWTELATGAQSIATLAGIGLVGVIFEPAVPRGVIAPIAIVFVGATAAAALFPRPELLGRVLQTIARHARRMLPNSIAPRVRAIETTMDEMRDIRAPRRHWMLAALLTAINWLADGACLWASLRAVDARVSWRAALVAFVVAQLLSMLPFTIGGLGFVEGGLVVVLGSLGLGATLAGAGALAYRAVSFWLLALVGWVCAIALAVNARRHDHGELREALLA